MIDVQILSELRPVEPDQCAAYGVDVDALVGWSLKLTLSSVAAQQMEPDGQATVASAFSLGFLAGVQAARLDAGA